MASLDLIALFGGMSLFLYGMFLSRDGIQHFAGERLKTLITTLTSNRVKGLAVGAVLTVLLQSSTALTVMLVGLAHAGLVSLSQAMPILLGADMGTTLTVQLIAFKLDRYALLIVTGGFVVMFFGKKQSLIGLDIGSHTVKVAELESHPKRGHRLVNWGISAPLAEAIVDGEIMDRQLVVDAISNLLESRSITTRNVVAAVSGRAVIVKKITMNKLSAEDAQQAVYWEAEQHVPYDINDVSLDFEILGPAPNDPKQMQVLLVAAKKDMVMAFSDLMREAGLNPLIVDVDSFAAQNALDANYEFGPEEVVATLNVGSGDHEHQHHAVRRRTTKDLQIGGSSFTEASSVFSLSQAEAATASRASHDIVPVIEQACEGRDRARARAAYLGTAGEARDHADHGAAPRCRRECLSS